MTLAAAELLCFGVTTTCEAYFFEDALADAVVAAGSRAVVAPGVLQLPGLAGHGLVGAADREIADFHHRRHGEQGRIEVGFAPHAAYTVPARVLAQTSPKRPASSTHCSTSIWPRPRRVPIGSPPSTAASAPAVLARAGMFDARVLAAHSIWLSEADLAIYVAHDVAVAHCPQSNAKLASGVAPLVRTCWPGHPGRPGHRRTGLQQRPRPVGGHPAGGAAGPHPRAGCHGPPRRRRHSTGHPGRRPRPSGDPTSGCWPAGGQGRHGPDRTSTTRPSCPCWRTPNSSSTWCGRPSRLVTDVWVAGRQVVANRGVASPSTRPGRQARSSSGPAAWPTPDRAAPR